MSEQETTIVQIWSKTENRWMDYARTTLAQAQQFILRSPRGEGKIFRGVDWIDKSTAVIDPWGRVKGDPHRYTAINGHTYEGEIDRFASGPAYETYGYIALPSVHAHHSDECAACERGGSERADSPDWGDDDDI